MRSIADDLRGEAIERVRKMTPGERIALTARLAAADVSLFAAARCVDERRARRMLAGQRQAGRRPSAVINALLEQ